MVQFKRKIFIRSKRDAFLSTVPAGGYNTKRLWLIRKDEEAVTPVIATILLVAITVMLISVLYIMLTGLLPGSSATGENSVSMAMEEYQDGNWTLVVRKTDSSSIPASSVRLTIYDSNGVIKLNRVSLTSLKMENWGTNRAVYQCQVSYPDTCDAAVLSAGHSISVFKNAVAQHNNDAKWWGYWSGYSYSLMTTSAQLASGTL